MISFLLPCFVCSDRSFKIVGNDFVMDGKPFRYISGSFHYFRQEPELWDDTLKKMANGGLNAIQTYVAWNMHEKSKGIFSWDGRSDLNKFLSLCQKYSLYVILRPGPYICAEWDLGGFPYWLLNLKLGWWRTADAAFLSHVDAWFQVLYAKVKPHMYHNGGSIILIQLENEYGAFQACDHNYMHHLAKLAKDSLGDETVLFTVDNANNFMAKCGSAPDVALATIDFGTGTDVAKAFAQQRGWNNGTGPYVNTEYYTGWLDHWGDEHNKVSWEVVCRDLDKQLALGGSVNMYMYYGGTNFGDMTGANGDVVVDWYTPDPTSYDYDAPLSESGDLTWKYWKILDIIKKYRKDIPNYPVANSTKKSYPSVTFTESVPLADCLNTLASKQISHNLIGFEDLHCPFCWIWYKTTAKKPGLLTGVIRDRAVRITNRKVQWALIRPSQIEDIVVPNDEINVLVESLGRINWGPDLQLDTKGLQKVLIDREEVTDWSIWAMDLNNISKLVFGKEVKCGEPTFFRGYFVVDEVGDTFLNPKGLKRGVAFVNGINVGRYWTVGPQLSLYVRKQYLRKGMNELVVLETDAIDVVPNVAFEDHPTIDIKPTPLHLSRAVKSKN
jgi:beta-galactosidase